MWKTKTYLSSVVIIYIIVLVAQTASAPPPELSPQELSSNEDINNWMASVGISQDALKLLPRLIRHSQSRRISNDPSGGWKPDPWMRARLDKRNAELINSLLGLPRIMKVVGKK